MTSWFDKTII